MNRRYKTIKTSEITIKITFHIINRNDDDDESDWHYDIYVNDDYIYTERYMGYHYEPLTTSPQPLLYAGFDVIDVARDITIGRTCQNVNSLQAHCKQVITKMRTLAASVYFCKRCNDYHYNDTPATAYIEQQLPRSLVTYLNE
jgi:hypothetical protein